MRFERVVKNVSYDYIANILFALIGLLLKTIFIHTLGQEYVGLNGLFSNVLLVLSLVDLGLGDAIAFELYSPLAKKDNKLILSLMSFYKNSFFILEIATLIH